MVYEENFGLRLARLRTKKGVSARDMSLSIGQNAGYINNIETGKSLPSMTAFFYICDFLSITPSEFFNEDISLPEEFHSIMENVKKLDETQLCHISALVEDLCEK